MMKSRLYPFDSKNAILLSATTIGISITLILSTLAFAVFAQYTISGSSNTVTKTYNTATTTSSSITSSNLIQNYQTRRTFIHGIKINLNGTNYYFEGPTDGENGTRDLPGHYWMQDASDHLTGLLYNIGPSGTTNWWSSDAKPDGILYWVEAKIAPWSNETAMKMTSDGFVHYQPLVIAKTGDEHLSLVAWLKHIAVSTFTLDKGPMPNMMPHKVTPGIDLKHFPNYMTPYLAKNAAELQQQQQQQIAMTLPQNSTTSMMH